MFVAGAVRAIGRSLLPRVLPGLLLRPPLAHPGLAVELGHRGLLLGVCAHACAPYVVDAPKRDDAAGALAVP
jgi:hypothetical protein